MKSKKLLSTIVTVGVATSCVAGVGAAAFADENPPAPLGEVQGDEEQQEVISDIAAGVKYVLGDKINVPAGTRIRRTAQNNSITIIDTDTVYEITSIVRQSGNYRVTLTDVEDSSTLVLQLSASNNGTGSDVSIKLTTGTYQNNPYFTLSSIQREGFYISGSNTYYYDHGTKLYGLQEIDGHTYYFYPDDSNWFSNDDGRMAKNTIVEFDEGLRAFDNDGTMIVGNFFLWNSNTYYLNEDGIAVTSYWYTDEVTGDKCYFDEDGKMIVDAAAEIDDAIYVFDDHGTMLKDGFAICDGDTYYLSSEGIATVSDWEVVDGSKYYFDAEGKMVTGLQTIDEQTYIFNEEGVMQARRFYTLESGDTYYLTADGTAKKNDWQSYMTYKHYFGADGIMIVDQAFEIDGQIYVFDEEGIMLKGGLVTCDGDTYYLLPDGPAMVSQWATVDGDDYYFDEEGKMVTGVQTIEDTIYIFDEDGVKLSDGWYGDYYLQPNGAAKVNRWQADPETNSWYYLGEDGVKVTGLKEINGDLYFFDSNGVMVSDDFFAVEDDVYYASANGNAISKTWKKVEGNWYYFDEDCTMVTGAKKIGDVIYVFDSEDGIMLSGGWTVDGITGDTYYLLDNGAAKVNKWQSYRSYWYYLGADGKMIVDQAIEIDGKIYVFDETGIMLKGGLVTCNDASYFLNADGSAVVNGWKKIDDQWYYFGADGKMIVDEVKEIGGKIYIFDDEGVMQADGWCGDYYLTSSGHAKVGGWVADMENDLWYYVGADGKKVTGVQTIGGKIYIFDEDGIMMTEGWVDADTDNDPDTDPDTYYIKEDGSAKVNEFLNAEEGNYFFDENGILVTNAVFTYQGNLYGVDEDGLMYANTTATIDGTTYNFDEVGIATEVEAPVVREGQPS